MQGQNRSVAFEEGDDKEDKTEPAIKLWRSSILFCKILDQKEIGMASLDKFGDLRYSCRFFFLCFLLDTARLSLGDRSPWLGYGIECLSQHPLTAFGLIVEGSSSCSCIRLLYFYALLPSVVLFIQNLVITSSHISTIQTSLHAFPPPSLSHAMFPKVSNFASLQAPVPKFGSWEGNTTPYTKCFEEARRERVRGFNPNDPDDNPEAFSQSRPAVCEHQHSQRDKHRPSANTDGGGSARSASKLEPCLDRSSSTQAAKKSSVYQRPATLPEFGGWNGTGERGEGYTVIFNKVKEKKQAVTVQLPDVSSNATAASKNKKTKRKALSKKLWCLFPRARD